MNNIIDKTLTVWDVFMWYPLPCRLDMIERYMRHDRK